MMLKEKQKIATVHGHMFYAILLYVTMFYIAIWFILLLVIHCIVDKVSKIDHLVKFILELSSAR